MIRICNKCNLQFEGRRSRKYCTRKCYDLFQSEYNRMIGRMPPSLKGKKRSEESIKHLIGANNWEWKGSSVGYRALHEWVEKWLGKPDVCQHCGRNGLKGKFIHWANKSGNYLRDLTDWLRLCAKCHKAYDRRYEKI